MSKLVEFLNNAARMYYNGTPIISDQVFDTLAESCGYNKIGYDEGATQEHLYPMYSLQKCYVGEGKPVELGSNDIDTSPKLDGAAVSHLYANGKLVRSLTRGDGVRGQIVTDKFLGTKLVPHTIDTEHPILQINGELAAPKHVENARNYSAGALNLKSVDEFKTRSVEFFAYSVQPYIHDTFREDMEFLKKLGFNTIKERDLHEFYPTDGVVFRLNNNDAFASAGYTSNHPRGAYALKERGTPVETKLLDVVWQTGKTGKVTPVAILEPININGAVVSRATLNNIAFIRALELEIGDTVGVIRAGEIIPQVTHKVV